jgi:transposase
MNSPTKGWQATGRSLPADARSVAPQAEVLPLRDAAADAPPAVPQPQRPPPRLRTANRQQLLCPMVIDDLLEPDHPARAVWRYVEGLDLSELYDRIRARGSNPGSPAIDPRLLVALWLYGTLQHVASARTLYDLCVHHDAYKWLLGGVRVNPHTLSDFRVDHPDFLQRLLEHSVNVLREQGLVDLDRVAQDGVRVRASAGAASFRTRRTLEKLLDKAQADLQALQQESEASTDPTTGQSVTSEPQSAAGPTGPSAQQRSAARRHARERVERLERALARVAELEAKKKPEDPEPRVSTTDPEATVMKMADGGYRPAYNVQYSTACGSRVIVGSDVVMVGNDQGQLPPMLDQIEERFEQRPKEALVDGGFVRLQDIEELQGGEQPSTVYAPVPKPKKEGVDRYQAKRDDSVGVAEWRVRMGTAEAKEIYKERAATAECVNAQARNRGLVQFLVRGLHKVRTVALWFAVVNNMACSFFLEPQPIGSG